MCNNEMLKCVPFTGRPNVGFMSINIKKERNYSLLGVHGYRPFDVM